MPFKKKIAPKQEPLKPSTARSDKYSRLVRSGKRPGGRPAGRNSSAR